MVEAGRGSIVNVSSISMWFGFPRRLSYITSKGGVGGMTQTLAVEWAPAGVRVNAVAPGMIETELVALAFDQGLVDRETAAANHALGRIGRPATRWPRRCASCSPTTPRSSPARSSTSTAASG